MRRKPSSKSVLPRLMVLLLSLALTGTLGVTLFSLPPAQYDLTEAVHRNMSETGVTNPITGVLLNFRGYDTLLEIGVLVVAALGMQALPHPPHFRSGSLPASGLILQALVRLVVPLMVLTAGYLLWAGSHAPGGAFQAGAILGAAAVLMLLAGLPVSHWFQGRWFRGALMMGFALFLSVGVLGIVLGGRYLEYPRDQAGGWILLIEASLTVSIGLILTTLYLGNPQPSPSRTARTHRNP